MLQGVGVILIFATVGAAIVTVCTILFERRGAQVIAGALAGAWLGILMDATLSGAIRQLPVLLAFFAVPLLAAAVSLTVVPGLRDRMLGIPRRLILGMNIFRTIGFLFLGLAYAGQLGGPFPYSAGIGDIIVGLVAIPLTLGEPHLTRTDARLVLWNALGLLDLVAAVALGVMSGNGTPLQLIHAGPGSAAIAFLPWSLIPLFLVPLFLISHVVIFMQMRERTRSVGYAVA